MPEPTDAYATTLSPGDGVHASPTTGTCMHGLYGSCAPTAHDRCRHCARAIKAIFRVPDRPDWLHEADGGAACPTTSAEPRGTADGGISHG